MGLRKVKRVLPRQRVIYVDVDGTLLLRDGSVNERLCEWLRVRHGEGYEIIVWTARGKAHAVNAVARCDLAGVVAAALSKPGVIVDDRGWGWRVYTTVIRVMEELW